MFGRLWQDVMKGPVSIVDTDREGMDERPRGVGISACIGRPEVCSSQHVIPEYDSFQAYRGCYQMAWRIVPGRVEKCAWAGLDARRCLLPPA